MTCTNIILFLTFLLTFYTVRLGKIHVNRTNVKKYWSGPHGYIVEGFFTSKYYWTFWVMLILVIVGYFCAEYEKHVN